MFHDDPMANHPCRFYEIARESYPQSLTNGLTAGLWWFPASILLWVRIALLPTLLTLLFCVGLLLALIIRHLLWLFTGLIGGLRDKRSRR